MLELPNEGTLSVGGTNYRSRWSSTTLAGSPVTAVANMRKAVAADAIAILDEGTGVDASWEIANKAHIPIGIVYQGGDGLVDPRQQAECLPHRAHRPRRRRSGSPST